MKKGIRISLIIDGKEKRSIKITKYNLKNIVQKHVLLSEVMEMVEEHQKEVDDAKTRM